MLRKVVVLWRGAGWVTFTMKISFKTFKVWRLPWDTGAWEPWFDDGFVGNPSSVGPYFRFGKYRSVVICPEKIHVAGGIKRCMF